jgi:hypothetical protein|tara:strand:+ start:1129 stop:1311 length:183 start_codon:yes stop_codon:yes gene_type:complete
MELLRKLKKHRRKTQHLEFLRTRINEVHNEIVHDVIENNDASNKAVLLKKYTRRLSLILY